MFSCQITINTLISIVHRSVYRHSFIHYIIYTRYRYLQFSYLSGQNTSLKINVNIVIVKKKKKIDRVII